MYLKSPWQHMRLLLLETMVLNLLSALLIVTTADTTDDVCDALNCLNNSPCRITTQKNVSTAKCVCLQGWIGVRCQARLKLSFIAVTMTKIVLRVDALHDSQNPKNTNQLTHSSIVSDMLTQYRLPESDPNSTMRLNGNINDDGIQLFNYSVHYWSGNQSSSCNILPKVSSNVVTISGLAKNTTYILCAKTQHEGWCNFDLVNTLSSESYCVSVTTKLFDDDESPSVPALYIVLAVSVATVALVTVLAVVIIAIRNEYFSRLICGNNKYNKRKRHTRERSRTSSGDMTHELLLLGTPPSNQRININPPSSPGKPKHLLVQNRTRGYASFNAKNEQTFALSTVIEYAEADDDHDDIDACDETAATDFAEPSGALRVCDNGVLDNNIY